MNAVTMSIQNIEVGDVVVNGYGTQTITHNTVSEISRNFTYGAVYTVIYENGGRFSDTPNGFHYAVIKADAEAHEAAKVAAHAYATAWDNKR